jgi:hypothetical protein
VGGIAIAAEGEKALTKATECDCEVDEAIAQMDARETILDGIVMRLRELSSLLKRLQEQATVSLEDLEAMAAADSFNTASDIHMEKLRGLLLVVSSLAQIIKTPVIGEDGTINPDIDVVIHKVSD